jgi:hypothetical protein
MRTAESTAQASVPQHVPGLDATDEREIEPALARYDTEQRRFGGSLVARARHLGAYLEAHSTQNEEEGR